MASACIELMRGRQICGSKKINHTQKGNRLHYHFEVQIIERKRLSEFLRFFRFNFT